MPVKAVCPACSAVFSVNDEEEGKEVRCEKCEQVFIAGAPRVRKRKEEEKDAKVSPWMQDAEVARRKGHGDQTGEKAKRSGKAGSDKRGRDDELDEKDPPRSRSARGRDEDRDDDPAPRRTGLKKSGGRLGLILGLSGGAAFLLLICCGVGAWFAWGKFGDNPNVNAANFERVQLNVPLVDVEGFFGSGRQWTGAEVNALLSDPHLTFGNAHLKDVSANSQRFGITRWYRWTNGPTTMFVGVDAANRVRVAGLVTITPHRTESNFRSNV
jgi:predicted Zn finger-like uncharacterized protein